MADEKPLYPVPSIRPITQTHQKPSVRKVLKPIQQLMDEHRVIVAVLAKMDAFAARMGAGEPCDQELLGKFAKFIREYADIYHHAKEEDILFMHMEQNGFSRKAGPIAVMLHEHDQGRQLVKFMRQAAAEPRPLTEDESDAVVHAIRSFCELLRSHIMKEDNILYPMASNQLPKEVMVQIANQFDKVEKERAAKGEKAALEALAAELL
jgi:hemerythrin-like domain-containing protein